MPNLLNTCDTCAELSFPSCEDLVIAASLDADTTYWWFVTDGQGNLWKGQATTDSDGVLTIAQSVFPDGMFTPGIGALTIEIKVGEFDLEPVEFSFSDPYTTYDCIVATFEEVHELNGYS